MFALRAEYEILVVFTDGNLTISLCARLKRLDWYSVIRGFDEYIRMGWDGIVITIASRAPFMTWVATVSYAFNPLSSKSSVAPKSLE